MNRIDQRPVAQALNGANGGQLQRHVLHKLDRQWLDSWDLAQSAQPDGAAAPANPSSAASQGRAANGALSDTPSAIEASASVGPMSRSLEDAAPRRAHDKAADRQRTGHEQAERPDMPAGRDAVAAMLGHVASAQAPVPSTEGVQMAGPGSAWPASAPTTALLPPPASPAAASLTTASPNLAFAQSGLPEPRASGETGSARKSAPLLPLRSADGDLGPQKLTLRELAHDQVQATLRDTQLDSAASRLAAQGLARALMEAGYAQVKVVVNGQHSRGEPPGPEDTAALDTPPPARIDSFSATAPKGPSHGN